MNFNPLTAAAPRFTRINKPSRMMRLTHRLGVWCMRYYYRRDLKRLIEVGPHMLADVGLKPSEAAAEIRKPIWRV